MSATKGLQDCITAICRFPRVFRNNNLSPRQIYIESDYKKYYLEITLEQIEDELRKDLCLIEDWERWSEDKRWSPAWWFAKDEKGQWVLGFESKEGEGERIVYNDRIAACALMVRLEMEGLRLLNKGKA